MSKPSDQDTPRKAKPAPQQSAVQECPTIHSANLLFLIAMMVTIVTLAIPIPGSSPHLASIIPMGLFLLLTFLFMRYHKLSLMTTLRLRWPGFRLAALSLMIGAGVWLVATWVGHLLDLLFGYSVPWSPDYFPTTPAEIAALFLAWCIAAPLGEEVLFRGTIQRAHERRGPRVGILVVAFLFALYHMSFQSLLAVLPIAMALGYMVWRSDSLIASVLVHFANNVLASGRVVAATLRPDLESGIPSLPAALVGVFLLLAGLGLFRRHTEPPSLPAPPQPTSWLRRAWPLLIAVLVFVVLAGLQFVVGRFPEALAFDRLTLQVDGTSNAPWEGPTRWTYELYTDGSYPRTLDEPVGRAECRLTAEPEGGTSTYRGERSGSLVLDCEVQKGHSCPEMDEVDLQQTVRWQGKDLQLIEGEAVQRTGEHWLTMSLARVGEGLVLSMSQDDGPVDELRLPDDALLMGEWPWRLSALPFHLSYSRKTTLAWPDGWLQDGQGSAPNADDTYVAVRNAEPVWTPVGNFITWRVTLGVRQTAWYNAEPPHTLVRYDDGTVIYLLTEMEQESCTDE
jgi:membrane protease YdiL (CAAX protease family)